MRDTFAKFLDQVYSTSERDKFRTRLERTPDGKGTEIYISHRGMNEVYTSPRERRRARPGRRCGRRASPTPASRPSSCAA